MIRFCRDAVPFSHETEYRWVSKKNDNQNMMLINIENDVILNLIE